MYPAILHACSAIAAAVANTLSREDHESVQASSMDYRRGGWNIEIPYSSIMNDVEAIDIDMLASSCTQRGFADLNRHVS